MIQIRKGVFETNSSSSHSIVLLKENNKLDKIPENYHTHNGGMHFYEFDLEFGRTPFEFLTDWYGRLRYAIASYSFNLDIIKDIEEICKHRIEGFNHFVFPTQVYSDEEETFYGYVDHQSDGLLANFLAERNISLEDFIFDDKYVVVIDGDEYYQFENLLGTKMFNKDVVEDIVSESSSLNNGGWQNI